MMIPYMMLGLRGRINTRYKFDEVVERIYALTGKTGQEGMSSPWLGMPLIFHVPTFTIKLIDGERTPAINLVPVKLSVLHTTKNNINIKWMVATTNDGPVFIRHIPSEQSISLCTAELFFSDQYPTPESEAVLRNIQVQMTLPGDDVEQLLSCYYSLHELSKLDIVTMNKAPKE